MLGLPKLASRGPDTPTSEFVLPTEVVIRQNTPILSRVHDGGTTGASGSDALNRARARLSKAVLVLSEAVLVLSEAVLVIVLETVWFSA